MQQTEAGIPVLTEVIHASAHADDRPEPVLVPPVEPSQTAQVFLPAPDAVRAALDEATLERIGHDVGERVLQQLMGTVDRVLEQRLRDSLADVLETALDGLACKVRHGLKQALEDTLAQAVADEMQNLRNPKTKKEE